MKNKTVSAIVPAYNKERKIDVVLKKLTSCSEIDEVICVYDGNDTITLNLILSVKNVHLIHSKKIKGKAFAIARGIEQASGSIILFIDADIVGLMNKNIQQLITPLKSGKYDFVIGYRCSRMEATVGVPIGGERAYLKKDLLPHIKHFEKRGYNLELYLNYHLRHKRKKICKLQGVFSYAKHAKYSYLTATKLYTKETFQIFKDIMEKENTLSYFLQAYVFYVYFQNQQLSEHYVTKTMLKYIAYVRKLSMRETERIEMNYHNNLKQLKNLLQGDTFENMFLQVKKIKNKKVRTALEKYYEKYVTQYIKK